jgi:hypothetical protein
VWMSEISTRYLACFKIISSSYCVDLLGINQLTPAKICRIHRFKSVGLAGLREECPSAKAFYFVFLRSLKRPSFEASQTLRSWLSEVLSP